jgi:hypothetical protein
VTWLAKSRSVPTPSGYAISTPILIPSFSSKAFEFVQENSPPATDDKATWSSLAEETLTIQIDQLGDAMLVSAYDIYHGHLGPDVIEHLAKPELVFIDSGGYECDPYVDLNDQLVYPYQIKPWSLREYEEVLKRIQQSNPLNTIAIVNFDKATKHRPFKEQIDAARDFFANWPSFLSVFLLKPGEKQKRFFDRHALTDPRMIRSLSAFKIIGVTEKELGPSLMDRLQTLAALRQAMNQHEIASPIHVFGSLDPLLSPLYFLAGAEVFDGLSWIKYFYTAQGLSTYWMAYSVLEGAPDASETRAMTRMRSKNLEFLSKLRSEMETVGRTQQLEHFTRPDAAISTVYAKLKAHLQGGR